MGSMPTTIASASRDASRFRIRRFILVPSSFLPNRAAALVRSRLPLLLPKDLQPLFPSFIFLKGHFYSSKLLGYLQRGAVVLSSYSCHLHVNFRKTACFRFVFPLSRSLRRPPPTQKRAASSRLLAARRAGPEKGALCSSYFPISRLSSGHTPVPYADFG